MRIFALAAFVGCTLASLAVFGAESSLARAEAPPQVTLLAAGSGKKAPLRYQLQAGATQTLTMTMDMQLAMSLRSEPGAAEMPMPRSRLPKTRITLELRVIEVAADGDASLEVRYRRFEVLPDPEVAPAVIAATSKNLAELSGLAGYMVVSNRGFVRQHRLDLPANLSSEAKQSLKNIKRSMDQVAAPLPEEPVGKGARWQVKTAVELNGAVLDMVSVVELKERKGKRVKIKAAIEQTGGRQDLELGGVKSQLVSAALKATAQNLIDLGSLAPRSATVKVGGDMQLEAMGQGVKVELALDVALASK